MNNKKYQVFISSTYTDLIEERRKVMDVLLMADCIPAGMEAFVATDNEQFEVIKKVIDLCDYYILILGKRYGTINPATGTSYTEMEYEYAKEKGIPVLVFAIDDFVKLDEDKCDSEEEKIAKLKVFRNKALTNRMASIWKNADELTGRVAVSIMRAKQEIIRPGWQRGADYDEASLRKQIMDLTAINKALGDELKDAKITIKELTPNQEFAFEECSYKVDFHYYRNSIQRSDSVILTLPYIFSSIALEMTDVMISESSIKLKIKNLVKCNYTFFLDDESFMKKALIQLKNLDLIYSSWNGSNKALYWGLTKKGIKTRDDMLLVKK